MKKIIGVALLCAMGALGGCCVRPKNSKRWRPSTPSSRGGSGFPGGPDETSQPSGPTGGG